MSATEQVRFVSFRIDRSRSGEAHPLPRRHLHTDPPGHVPRYFSLHADDVAQIELVALCPQMPFRRRLNQIGRDANSLSGVEHGAFQECVHLELPRNLRQGLRGLPVADHRLVREHSQRADLPELDDQCLRHAIHEVFLLGAGRDVLQWQHGNGSDVDCSWSADHLVAHSADIECEDEQNEQQGEHDDGSRATPTPRGRWLTNLRGILQTAGECEDWRAVHRGNDGGDRRPVYRDGRVDDGAVDWIDEAIPATRQGLDEPRGVGRISERFPQLVDRRVDAVIEVHDRPGPELLLQLLARDELARLFQEHCQHLQGLLLESDSDSLLAQLSCPEIDLEHPEPNDLRGVGYIRHRQLLLVGATLALSSHVIEGAPGSDFGLYLLGYQRFSR